MTYTNYERLIVIGNATRDAQVHEAREGATVFATFALAVNKARDHTNFYSVIVFGPTAETAAEAIKRGDLVFVEGSLNFRPFTTRLNKQRVEIQVQAEQWLRLHGRLSGSGPEEKPTPGPA